MTPIIKASNLVKIYPKGLRALDNISMVVKKKEVLVVMGPSGSGKSTLIRTFNGLESFNSGRLEVVGIPLDSDHVSNADAVLIVTHHDVIDWSVIGDHASLIIDTRNAMSDVPVAGRLVKA